MRLPGPSPAQAAAVAPSASVVFLGEGAYLITGQYSRKVYHFSQEQPEQRVDLKDVDAMVQTGLFEMGR